MATRIRFYPHKLGGQGVKALANAFDTLQVKPDGKYRPQATDMVVNWGNSTIPKWNPANTEVFLNECAAIALASNKINAFRALDAADVPTLYWTTNEDVAREWLKDGDNVFARSVVQGHGGKGITVISGDDDIPADTKFFTKHAVNKNEYRVHVFNGEVIDVVQKRRMNKDTLEERGITVNEIVRNHDNGWVFARQDVQRKTVVDEASVAAIKALGLDFGAVDVVYLPNGKACVLEVNTAPGLEGTTLENYINAFRRYYESTQ
jgi:glutathione synthase/RimK-type ligase-like ATP-grasp enzyme